MQKLLLTLLLSTISLGANPCELLRDLAVVQEIDREIHDFFPVTYNNYFQGGYLVMPSAQMGGEGEFGGGYASLPPYRIWNARGQPFETLEISFNYRIFKGIPDPVMGGLGFGDFSDKGANLKFAPILPKDSDYTLPGIALGWDDFLGTRSFESFYIVGTQVFLPLQLEASFGYGWKRINGFFGGVTWFPFRLWCVEPLKNLAFTAEWDATDYKNPEREPHPDGRTQKTHFNFGFKTKFWDLFHMQAGYIRGEEFSFALSASYNFGYTKGFLPKFHDPLPYHSPKVVEPIGYLRPEAVVTQDFLFALREQGFELLSSQLTQECDGVRTLRLEIVNCRWPFERTLRRRLNHILAQLTPGDIDEVIAIFIGEGCPLQEYRFHRCFLDMYSDCTLGDAEMELLTPRREISKPPQNCTATLFSKTRTPFHFQAMPKIHTFFGSSAGKFKYALGLSAAAEGYLPGNVYYNATLGWIFLSKLENLIGMDIINPSQLINVHTDIIEYYKKRGVTVDKLYLQKNVHFLPSWFAQIGVGYFEQNYGGIAGEILYYPVNSSFAIGLDGALLWKRQTQGLGFTDTIRQFVGRTPTFVPFTGYQYFLNAYYDLKEWEMLFKLSAGQFLARDLGIRFEWNRYFPNGVEIYLWYTLTNGNDIVNGHVYYDKGVGITMPLDFFYPYSCRKYLNWAMSAWLRDVGYRGPTGQPLYPMIHSQRIE